MAATGVERSIFYTQLLQIVDDDQYPVDSLATQADSVKTLLTEAETGITNVTGLVQGVQARPYVAVSNLVQDLDAVAFDDTLRITATVKNLGATPANDIVVSLTTDAAGLVVSQASYSVGTLASDAEQTFEFAIRVIDGTVTVHGYRVNLTSSDALVVPASGSYNVSDFTGIEVIAGEIPTSYTLGQSFPNPFNPQTTITFSVPAAGQVSIEVFDILGRQITTLVDEVVTAGSFQAVFDARDLPSGTYFYRMHAADFTEVRSMILVK